jgi:uncharacterized repeat protein (TIGR03803 family)
MLRYLQDLISLVLLGSLAFNAPPAVATRNPSRTPDVRPPRVVQQPTSSPLEQMLYAFQGGTDGSEPMAGLLADASGNLYGTVPQGGGNGEGQRCALIGCGAVFKLTPGSSGYTESIVYGFYGPDYNDGDGPYASLIADNGGALYGTTVTGGRYGLGTVFELRPNASGHMESVLYAFEGGSDGSDPFSDLIADGSGTLYGTTYWGGGSTSCNSGCGTVFKLTPAGLAYKESVLHRFKGGADGFNPYGGLIADESGALYGTTSHGGSACDSCGTVFKLTPRRVSASTTLYSKSTLYAFRGGQDGSNPVASLLADEHGNLYGTTGSGGGTICDSGVGCGTVFELVRGKVGYTERILHRFLLPSQPSDGLFPESNLIFHNRALYGTTVGGGQPGFFGYGTVFKLTPTPSGWAENVIYIFHGPTDGAYPYSGLIANRDGALFGTTSEGGGGGGRICGIAGAWGCGTVYNLRP